ncbi:SusD/RagB family nutrient-binding outer membrane lipoprotein [Flavobacterium aquicola]|uniref:SusD-like starch-binding protein associating with outer membrane n=1 Tax=Flavobacterium aquicola TaxID=1682742 RepID=A0A3E0ETH5_9FLAO|nr:SusD/RagB family nutrient-binding outer membrane lipoprotein [Flavobacterium aquicola]REH01555.1 SusD-like starch-binding protein associating with outer membrane [Flavobacterium aquicola]
MKTIQLYKSVLIIVMVFMVGACTNFEDLADDPNRATSVPPSMLLTEVLRVMNNVDDEGPWSSAQRDNQFWAISFDYYGEQDYNWGSAPLRYTTMSNVQAMVKEAEKLDTKNKYAALAKFFDAYFLDYMSKRMGDIPMTESLKAKSDDPITKPKYDAQKDVYIEILRLLDAANDQITAAKAEVGTGAVQGDFLYKGDLDKWQRAINSFHLRVLISLSKKTADINVISQFKGIISNPSKYPLMRGIEDNMTRNFSDENGNNYALNPGNFGRNRNRDIMAGTYLNILKQNNDPRIYKVADPAAFYFKANDPLNLNAYIPANTGDEQGSMQVASDEGKLSYPSEKRYYSNYVGEGYILFGYAEQQFVIAEAINRGWIDGSAAAYYNQGIKASMDFYNVSSTDISSFLSNANVVYKGNNTAGLEQILTQKYVAFFQNSEREAYFNYRRTGIPKFDVGPANKNNGKIPMRWKYPQSEFETNSENVKAALASQYGGTDDINAVMWLLK